MKNGLTRFGVSLNSKLLDDFDRLISRKGYTNRSEALRDLIRDSLVQAEWEAGDKETVGTITLVYNHHTRELTHVLTDLQHHYHQAILSTTHIHLDEHNCLEVLVVKGKARDVKRVADRLIGTKGVKHGKLAMATTGKGLV
ncbi:MAG TPA: nickel-responsive transcriptional regulator NikR [Candidatus Hypogeohydataceae bacterium YC41]